MDYGAFPPEFNSTRMYSGPGSAPMLAAAAAWDGLATELNSTTALYQSTIDGLVGEGWLGPASASMVAAVTPYLKWTSLTGAQAELTAAQAAAAAAAYEAAFAMTVPPAAVAANRTQLTGLIATNVFGQNTPAIAVTEEQYAEMWAQDAAAMYGYAAGSATASELKPFALPPQTTDPTGQADQATTVAQVTSSSAASGTQETLSQVTSTVPTALQSLATSSASTSGLWDFLNTNFVNGVVSGGYLNPVMIEPAILASMADANAVALGSQPGTTALPPMGSGEGNDNWLPLVTPSPPTTPFSSATVPLGSTGIPGAELTGASASTNQAAFVGRLAVPQSWTAAAQVENHAGAAFAGGGWSSTPVPESPTAVPGMPGVPAVNTAGRHFGTGPRYGFHVTVMPRPPAAG